MFEHLPTHRQCWECGYSPDKERPITKIRRELEREALQSELVAREVADEQLEQYFREYHKSKGEVV